MNITYSFIAGACLGIATAILMPKSPLWKRLIVIALFAIAIALMA